MRGIKPKYKIRFVNESKPLGTIGSLSLIKKAGKKPDCNKWRYNYKI